MRKEEKQTRITFGKQGGYSKSSSNDFGRYHIGDTGDRKESSTKPRTPKWNKNQRLGLHDEYMPTMDYPASDDRRQAQEQAMLQHQHSAEASTQMVYAVYGNVISILEEFEQREIKEHKMTQLPDKSNIYIPDQSHKKNKDIKSILETQLLLMESQLKFCRLDIRERTVKHLKDLTLQWIAGRESIGISPDQKTDQYLGQLFEILARGKLEHPRINRDLKPGDVKNVSINDMETVLTAQAEIAHLDKQFEDDPKRKAKAPSIREGDVQKGAERLLKLRKDLSDHVPQQHEGMDLT